MPSYDYKCKTCDNTTTLIIGIKEQAQTPICANCKAEMVRSYGIAAVKFKGSGWASKEK